MIAVGLMSGTSLDGIDAAYVEIVPAAGGYDVRTRSFATFPFDDGLRQTLRSILPPNGGCVEAVANAHRSLGEAFARAALDVAAGSPIDYVASHGQTVWHDGERSVTLQIGDPFVIRERTGATVCFDFRSADCAAGGHGAPLVPHVDALLYASASEDRVLVNVGGIANVTVLPRDGSVAGCDTGPGNMLLDAFVNARTNGAAQYDDGGALGLAGTVDVRVLDELLGHPYFAKTPPKTTGREEFGAQFLRLHAAALEPLSLEDGCATLAALTAETIAREIRLRAPSSARVLVGGGGASNAAILAMLAERLPAYRVERSEAMKIDSAAKEAVAFAVLGYETLRERVANVPRVTGARRAVALGAIAPHDLRALLTKVEDECRKFS